MRLAPRACRATALATALAIMVGHGAVATGSSPETQNGAVRAAFDEQRAQEQQLQDIGWKLVTANARYCDSARPAVGLQLHDMASYGNPGAVRALLGLSSDFAILVVAKGSPADLAGLATGTEITAIEDSELAGWPTERSSDWRRTVRAHDLIDRALEQRGQVRLAFADGREAELTGVAACRSRFELGGEGKRALAEGKRVIFERDFPGFTYAGDEFAAAVAHELAHNLLGHRTWLDTNGRKQSNVRLTEREADRLMPWLLANAGYDPQAAARFMQRWGPRHSGGIFRKRSHEGWDERVEAIDAEAKLVEGILAREGTADWQRHFLREIEPAG